MILRVRAIATLLSLIGTTVCAQVVSSNTSTTIDEATEAAVRFRQTGNDVSLLPFRHPDGVKGTTLEIEYEPPPYTLALADKRLDALRVFACTASVFGAAELVSIKPFVGKDGAGIYSKMHFKVIDDWRSDVVDNKNEVQIVSPGGEVIRKGERIRITNARTNFRVGGRYVIITGNRFPQKSNVIYEHLGFFEIINDTIFSAPGWTPFPHRMSVEQAKADVLEATSMRACK